MVKSPLQIIIELLAGLSQGLIEDLNFMYSKIFELFVSLSFLARINPLGFSLAITIGSIVLFLILKFAIGYSKTLVLLVVISIILILFGVGVTMITTPIVANTTISE